MKDYLIGLEESFGYDYYFFHGYEAALFREADPEVEALLESVQEEVEREYM